MENDYREVTDDTATSGKTTNNTMKSNNVSGNTSGNASVNTSGNSNTSDNNETASGKETGGAGGSGSSNKTDTQKPDQTGSADPSDHDNTSDREDVCFICRRPESKAGKMFKLMQGMCICPDCMNKTMTTVTTNFDYQGMLNNPNISFMNLADLQGEGFIPNKQKIKKKKEGEESKPLINLKDIPAPHKIKGMLDEYVVGQDYAKKVMSVAVYNHYKRVATKSMDDIEIEKSNMLMIGPTGCGKTYLVRTLAKLLNVPLAIADATSLTEAGYIGDDIESVISKLLAAADNDVEKAEQGIVFIDEIDKIAKKSEIRTRDVSGESVQQGMLKLLEGAEIEVPVGASSKTGMVPLVTVNTRNILFICGGAFPDLEETIRKRLNKQSGIGYGAAIKDTDKDVSAILKQVKPEDLREFGMIPEFIGRLPVIFTLQGLDKDMMVKILKEPKNAILKQYQKLLELDEVKLEFDDDALEAIAEKALERDTGARALRSVIEEFMLDIMYEIPKDDNIGTVTITGDYIRGTGGPIIQTRG